MDPVKSGWQELLSAAKPECPKLFYKFTADDNGYDLQFTDLIGLWSTKTSNQDIRDYAKTTRASIDASESKSQLRVLLQKLERSLVKGTSTLSQAEGADAEAILLQTRIDLPKPLQALKWEFYLESRGAGEMAENILRPCLHEASESKKKIDSLCEVIKAKDHVISRLVEKIEGSSIDLSLIFPGITGVRSRKGQVTVKDAQRHVPALKPFVFEQWKEYFESDGPYTSFEGAGLSRLMSGCEKCPKHTTDQHEKWLKKLPKASSTNSQIARGQLNYSSPVEDPGMDSSNDEFETQRRRKSQQQKQKQTIAKAATSSSSDADEARPAKLSKPSLPTTSTAVPNHNNRASSDITTYSSSPMLLPLPKLSHKPTATTNASSTADEDSDSDLDARPKKRLGPLDKPPLAVKSKVTIRNPEPPSSSPSPARPAHQASYLPSSSPPPLPRVDSTFQNDHRLSSPSLACISSSPSADKPSTPHKLGRLGGSTSATATPESTRRRSQRERTLEVTAPSTQVSPSHQLGRLRRGASQAQAQSQRNGALLRQNMTIGEDDTTMLDFDDSDEGNKYDASTASTASSALPASQSNANAPATSHGNGETQPARLLKHPSTIVSQEQPEPEVVRDLKPEPEPELSKEEKANRRREELKRKFGTADTDTAPTTRPSSATTAPVTRSITANTTTGAPLRKKRKF